MELEIIKTQTTWNDAAESINRNNLKVTTEIHKLQSATYKNKGYFSSAVSLADSYPTANAGSIAYVGYAHPYMIYAWDTTTSRWVNTGNTGGDESVELGDYYTTSETDIKFAKKDEVKEDLLNYYTKEQSDESFISPTQLEESLENVYSKEEADDEFVNQEELNQAIEALMSEVGDTFINSDELSNILAKYYTKLQSDSRFLTSEDLEQYYTKDEAAGVFINSEKLNSLLLRYYTKVQSDATFVKLIDLVKMLGDYYNKEETDSRFIDSAELERRIGGLATDLELANAVSSLENKIKKAEAKLGDYYTKDETHEAIKDEYEVLSQTAYESLVSKEEKLYFCYEEDE
jgi:DNA-directed RNA polymerase delta subunit